MASRDVLKMLMCGPVTHLTKWCVIGEKNSSSGTVINDISDLVPEPVNLYKLADGVLLDVPPQEIANLFPEDNTWGNRYILDNRCNNLLYTIDMRILDMLCALLKNNGLNMLLTKAKAINTQKDIGQLNGLTIFILGMVLNNKFCNYSSNIVGKLKTALSQMPFVYKHIQDMQAVIKKSVRNKSAVLEEVAKYLISLGVFNFSDEFWTNLASLLVILGAQLSLEECVKNKWNLQAKVNVVMQYIIKMNDRHLFNSVYNIKNTFTMFMGTFLQDNNYIGDYNCVSFPAYKLSVSEMANIVESLDLKATVYLHGLADKKYAVLFDDITSFTALEMLKEGWVSDGETCIVFQQILQYEV